MADLNEIHTTRLLLRQWKPADRAPFAAMNADPRVMRHFPAENFTDAEPVGEVFRHGDV